MQRSICYLVWKLTAFCYLQGVEESYDTVVTEYFQPYHSFVDQLLRFGFSQDRVPDHVIACSKYLPTAFKQSVYFKTSSSSLAAIHSLIFVCKTMGKCFQKRFIYLIGTCVEDTQTFNVESEMTDFVYGHLILQVVFLGLKLFLFILLTSASCGWKFIRKPVMYVATPTKIVKI